MPVFAELEFAVGPPLSPKGGYTITPRLRVNGQDELFGSDLLLIDLDELSNLRTESAKYEARLSELFFQAVNAKDAIEKATVHLDQAGPGNMLRVRLFIQPTAAELHHVRWECLRDTVGNPLFNGDNIFFSRFLASANLRPLSPKAPLKALVAIANPPKLDQAIDPENPDAGLAPIDVPNEKLRAETGLTRAGFAVTTLAAAPNGTLPATVDNILNELAEGYDIFYLVCHGGLVPEAEGLTPMLWLDDSEDPVNAHRLVEGLRNIAHQPRLVVLASCQSAGADGSSAAASGTLGALGPLLAAAGVPAIIAMQGNIKMSTVDRFMPRFLAELAKDGLIDRAMGKARGHILDCTDYWMPALFTRLSDGIIWNEVHTNAAPPAESPAADSGDAAADQHVKDQARKIFSDLSVTSAVFPAEHLLDAGAQPGEVAPLTAGIWKQIAPSPHAPSYAMFSAFSSFRAVVLGHEHMATFEDASGNNYFVDACLSWLKASGPATIILSAKKTDTLLKYPANTFNLTLLRNQLEARGYHVDAVADLSDANGLAQAGIVMILNAWGDFAPQEISAITNFVNGGGGLLAAGLGWSWPHPLAKYPMNRLLKPFGAQWTAQ